MKRFGIGFAALLGAVLAGPASAQYFASSALLKSGPSDSEIAAAWPAAAKAAGVEGEARIQCRVSAQGVIDGCQVLQETPAGQGFGQAALALTPKFKAEGARVGGQPTDGIVRFILRFPPNAPSAGPDTAGPYTFPETVEKPSEDQIYAAWPGVARANSVEGRAVLSCIISLYGRLEDCRVSQETPTGLGFGEGAMRLRDKFRFLPGTKDTMSIPIRMSVPVDFQCKTRCAPFKLPSDFVGKLVSVAWTVTPTTADLAAASPKGLGGDQPVGRAQLFCRLKADGGADRCRVVSEQPASLGVGAAALSLAPLFKTTNIPKDFVGAGVQIPISFSNENGRPVLLRRPVGEDYAPLLAKAAADPNVTDASVLLNCTVNVAALSNCSTSAETPPGLGLAEAALALAPKFSVSQWGENGRPTQGAQIKVPLALTVRDPAKDSDQVVTITDPQWLRRPTASDMERYYPEHALSAEKSGVVRMQCKVNAAGDLSDCTIVSEAPVGFGFGGVALKMAGLFKMKPPAIDGHPITSASVEVPIIFRLN